MTHVHFFFFFFFLPTTARLFWFYYNHDLKFNLLLTGFDDTKFESRSPEPDEQSTTFSSCPAHCGAGTLTAPPTNSNCPATWTPTPVAGFTTSARITSGDCRPNMVFSTVTLLLHRIVGVTLGKKSLAMWACFSMISKYKNWLLWLSSTKTWFLISIYCMLSL